MTSTFGALLAASRTRAQLSQMRLGQLAGLDHSTLTRLENGTRNPTRDSIDRIVSVMEMTTNDRDRLYAAAGYWPPAWDYGYTLALRNVAIATLRGMDYSQDGPAIEARIDVIGAGR